MKEVHKKNISSGSHAFQLGDAVLYREPVSPCWRQYFSMKMTNFCTLKLMNEENNEIKNDDLLNNHVLKL